MIFRAHIIVAIGPTNRGVYYACLKYHHHVGLSAIRAQRKALIDSTGKTTGGRAFEVQILLEIGTTAAVAVFEVHRVLLSAERSGPSADLLDVSQRFLRLFALCKVSGDVAKEASKTGNDNYNSITIELFNIVNKHKSAVDDVGFRLPLIFYNYEIFSIVYFRATIGVYTYYCLLFVYCYSTYSSGHNALLEANDLGLVDIWVHCRSYTLYYIDVRLAPLSALST